MPRVTAPVSKLARALSSTPTAARVGNPLLLDTTVHNAGAVLMPKYAELLRNRRSSEHSDSSRGLTTAHRPTPQPSLANRNKPLMQTFSSSAASAASVAATSTHLDAAVLPAFSLEAVAAAAGLPRMPLLPDNYGAAHSSADSDGPVVIPSASIVAANPDNVLPATALSSVHGIGLDSVSLQFVHIPQPSVQSEDGQGMIKDLWKGLVDDVFGSNPVPKTI
ncbi:hypothetical protein PT974_05685 [Cladobotryum mycophilum]|uniref:Uncharacterized protein n=1 Tax=Cladobotryum mycophilum TaxID=491253 RepID=A0ABR0SJS8_9HYPO